VYFKIAQNRQKNSQSKKFILKPPPFGPFLAKYDPQTPQKAQNSEKAN